MAYGLGDAGKQVIHAKRSCTPRLVALQRDDELSTGVR